MEFRLPPKFERDTLWLYVRAGVEYGPFSASDVLTAIRDHKIDAETTVCELQSGQRSPLLDVKPFAEYLAIVAREDALRKADEEFDQSTKRTATRNRSVLVALGIGAAVLVGGLVTYIVWPKPDESAATTVAQNDLPKVDPTFVKPKETPKTETLGMGERDMAVRTAPSEAGTLDDHLKAKLMSESQLATAGQVDLAGRKKVEDDAAAAGKKKARRKAAGGAQGAEGAQGEGSNDYVLDFGGSEEGGAPSPASSKSLAEDRLGKALRECTKEVFKQAGGGEGSVVTASAKLDADGRLSNLRLQLEPSGGPLSDIKMCVSTEMPGMQVPAYDGSAETIYATVRVGQ